MTYFEPQDKRRPIYNRKCSEAMVSEWIEIIHKLPVMAPGVWQMLDAGTASCPDDYRDQIEAISVGPPTHPNPPALRHPADGPTLPPVHRLRRRAAYGRAAQRGAAGLHFDEGDERPAAGNQVHIVPPRPVPVGLDVPATGREVREGQPFAPQASEVAGVLPLTHRHERPHRPRSSRHGRTCHPGSAISTSVRRGTGPKDGAHAASARLSPRRPAARILPA